jgi:hypothetical protein
MLLLFYVYIRISSGTEIAFTNGELDPWHMLSIYPPTITTLTSSSSTKRYNSLEKKGLIDDGTIKVGPVDDNDGHVERKHWRLYLIQNGSHCNDFREPGVKIFFSFKCTMCI